MSTRHDPLRVSMVGFHHQMRLNSWRSIPAGELVQLEEGRG